MFFLWQDGREEAWLGKLSSKGQRLDSVSFPFTYHFSPDQTKVYAYHLSSPADPAINLDTFVETYKKSGWEHVGRMNGWHYFRKEISGESEPVLEWGNKIKAAKYQKFMMFLVGLLPFLFIIFPAVGKRIAPPLYDTPENCLFHLFRALYPDHFQGLSAC